MTITEFLLARIVEDEADATPRTMVVSGGWPAPEVPNCIGVGHTPCSWRLEPTGVRRWWDTPETSAIMRAHEMTHATAPQLRALRECAAKRAIVELFPRSDDSDPWVEDAVLCPMAAVYRDHPDYWDGWRI